MNEIILSREDTTPLRIEPSRTIFWTGAGISCIPPSNLPLGNPLTDAYLEAAFGPDKWKEFVVLWNNRIPRIRDAVQNGTWHEMEPVGKYNTSHVDSKAAWERPRLEYIIGEMDKMDRFFNNVHGRNKRKSSISALKHFADVQPC